MKKGIYSNLLTCENKDKFTVAKAMGFDGIILDFNENTLYNLPNRNYYVLQSLKTELSIPALSISRFKTVNLMGHEYLQETKKSLMEYIDICDKMKVELLILPFIGASQITTDDDLKNAIELLSAICPFGETNDVSIGIIDDLSNERREKLMTLVNSTNLVSINNGISNWNIIDTIDQLAY
jgi:sugar phosphate isomerase/epimerase